MSDTTPPRDWYSVDDAAEHLGLSPSTVYALIKAGKLGHRRIGLGRGIFQITRQHIDDYLNSCEVPPTTAITPTTRKPPCPSRGGKLRSDGTPFKYFN